MGVMERLFRRSKAARQADTDGTVVDGTVAAEAAAPEAAAVASGTAAGSSAGGTESEESAEDGAGIPRQQSSGKAADGRTGENART